MTIRFELRRSDKENSRHEYHWFVTRPDDHYPVYSVQQSGDASMRACLTWIANQGASPIGETFPECNLFA